VRVDLDFEWRRQDRTAWVEYRKWEDKHIPFDPGKPWKDPPGLIEARRAFENQQQMARDKFFKEARYGGRK
jgi:hypothetical protein